MEAFGVNMRGVSGCAATRCGECVITAEHAALSGPPFESVCTSSSTLCDANHRASGVGPRGMVTD